MRKKGERKRGKYLEKENIFLWRRRKRRKLFCAEENKNGEGTGGKYLEKDFFSWGRKKGYRI